MSRDPVTLPHIEDATFLACLAPRADMDLDVARITAAPASDEPKAGVHSGHVPGTSRAHPDADTTHLSGTHPATGEDATPPMTGIAPRSLAEWRSLADREFAEFRVIELFLAKTDRELAAAVQTYPRQILGLLERISNIEDRLARQNLVVATLMRRLHTAILQVAIDPRSPHADKDLRAVLFEGSNASCPLSAER